MGGWALRVLQYLIVFMSAGLKLVTAVLVISLKIIPEICNQQTSVERDYSEQIFVMIVIGFASESMGNRSTWARPESITTSGLGGPGTYVAIGN